MKIYLYLNNSIPDKQEVTDMVHSVVKRKGITALDKYISNKYIILNKGNDKSEIQMLVDGLQENQSSYNLASVFYA